MPFDRAQKICCCDFRQQQGRCADAQREQQQTAQAEGEAERRAAAKHIGRLGFENVPREGVANREQVAMKMHRAFSLPVVPEVNAIKATSSCDVGQLTKPRGKFWVAALLFLLALPVHSAEAPAQNVLAITHATVIDGTGTGARPDVTVIVAGDHITATGKTADVRVPTNAVVVDATGKYLIPGLWDMHVHWYDQ